MSDITERAAFIIASTGEFGEPQRQSASRGSVSERTYAVVSAIDSTIATWGDEFPLSASHPARKTRGMEKSLDADALRASSRSWRCLETELTDKTMLASRSMNATNWQSGMAVRQSFRISETLISCPPARPA
jgi:hypothetical protein